MNRNGIAIEEVQGHAEALAAHPGAGAVTVRTRHRWGGGYNLACQAEELTLAGEPSPRTHTIRIAMPTELGGDDAGPVPGEALLAALGGCVGQLRTAMRTSPAADSLANPVPLQAVARSRPGGQAR